MSAYAKLARAMAITAPDVLYLPSPDVTADVAFYGSVLGARLVREHDAIGTRVAELELSPRGVRVALVADLAVEGPVLMRGTDDLDTKLAELGRCAILPSCRLESAFGPAVMMQSPGGQRLGLYQPRARGSTGARPVAAVSAEPGPRAHSQQ